MSDPLAAYAAACTAWVEAAQRMRELGRLLQSAANTVTNMPGTNPFHEPSRPAHATTKAILEEDWPSAGELVTAAAIYSEAQTAMQAAWMAIPPAQRISQKNPQDVRGDFMSRK